MVHDEVIVLENVADQTDQLDALRIKGRIELLIDRHQPK
jgi:hypothetical protein